MVSKSIIGAVCACLAVVSFSASAALVGRLAATPGGTDYQAYYDTDADLTWLADANAAVGSAYDYETPGTGYMSWADANAWAAGLDVDGVTGWRLPTTMQPDTSCDSQSNQGSSFPLQGFGTGCTGSEMGHLFNVEGISSAAPGPFSNVQSGGYWSGTEFAPNTIGAWDFGFDTGGQYTLNKSGLLFAWAAQSGDVSAVPVPAAVWLFGSGLLGLVGVARRKSANI